MKHWFVSWLENWAEHKLTEAAEYRRALNGGTPEAKNLLEVEGTDGILEQIIKFEGDAERFKSWGQLSEDMLGCGLEEAALAYHDAKQAIAPHLLPLRPHKKLHRTLDKIADRFELLIDEVSDPENLQQVKAIYVTLCELTSAGMNETALVYYLRVIRKYAELKLPEPSEEELMTKQISVPTTIASYK